MVFFLLRRKARSVLNSLLRQSPWERARNAAFLLVGLLLIIGLYAAFWRLLRYLDAVPVIGTLLIWKLTALALLTTFSMVALSSLVTSLTTLFYAYDLPFLMKAPVSLRTVFVDKSAEATFYASWMIAATLLPYLVALAQVKHLGVLFLFAFAGVVFPFLALASSVGMAFTLALMRLFPSPRTRDMIWILSSFSVAMLYVLLRISQPERLVRPDMLELVAQYLSYLQAPTAPALPSWWLTRALWGCAHARWDVFWTYAALLYGVCAATYGALVYAAGRVYADGYSGAQEGRRSGRDQKIEETWETRWARGLRLPLESAALFRKERLCFFRDVKHWSQILLVAALVCVYLFSIDRLPLDSPDIKSLVSFLNLAVAGFVLSSLGLRFTFPSISLEGRSFWVLRASPLRVETMMRQKYLFTLAPSLLVGVVLILVSNRLLHADRFISSLSLASISVMALALTSMGVGFGALFPKMNVPNIHQVESSAGGFVYMAACLAFVVATVAIEAWPVQMYFQNKFGKPDAWDWTGVSMCLAGYAVVNAVAFTVPWVLGRRNLESHEERNP
ncbi:MAG: hypothetical protein HY551_00030 [Elusimicrobia bacterium]|nr:hypothetical protein [Elusimicrobiota bacterium]